MPSVRRSLQFLVVLSAFAAPAAQASIQPTDSVRYRSVAAARGFTCALTTESALYCWGVTMFDREPGRRILGREVPRPGRHQLCGFRNCRKTPLRILERSTFTQLDVATNTSGVTVCATQSDGKTLCWGSNGHGQTGADEHVSGSEGDSVFAPPREVRGGTRFTGLALGPEHTCGISTDSTAYCWGSGAAFPGAMLQGTRGFGTRAGALAGEPCPSSQDRMTPLLCVPLPTVVNAGTKYIAISAGGDFTCAVALGGRTECWGDGPASGPADLTVSSISAGGEHVCALSGEGAAFCWGRGNEGQLGAGTTASDGTPHPVSGGLRFKTIAAGGRYTCALTPEGAAYCWGAGAGGQLGTGDTASSNTPRPVAGGLTFQAISAGYDHTCAISSGGAMYCWGKNGWANLGNGGRDDSLVPVRVAEP